MVWVVCESHCPIQVKDLTSFYGSLGCMCAASSSVAHIQGASFLPVLGERGAHVTLQPLDGSDHQVVHWNKVTKLTNRFKRDFCKATSSVVLCGIPCFKILPLTFPRVCLEFRPIMGSVATPLSLPFSRKEEERRQAVPTWPGWVSPWTTCSPISSWKQR